MMRSKYEPDVHSSNIVIENSVKTSLLDMYTVYTYSQDEKKHLHLFYEYLIMGYNWQIVVK